MSTDQAISQLIPAPRAGDRVEGVGSTNPIPPTPTPLPTSARHLAGKRARVSVDNAEDLPFLAAMFIETPPDADSTWRTSLLDDQTLDRIEPARLIELLIDISPEISRALWDFVRMFNPGWECKAFKLNSDTEDKRGQAVIDAFITQLGELYGAFDVVLSRLIIGGMLRGAFLAEIVLDENGREAIDLATPDPYSVRFKKAKDPVRGNIWVMGQWQGSEFKILDAPTINYIPIDPAPGKPYGRSMVAPAIFLALFLIGLLHDLRRVIAQQGYPRIDISIDLEKLATAMPSIAGNPEEFKVWVNQIVDEIGTVYTGLQPDDAYVHTSVIGVNRPVGAVDSSSLGAVDGLLHALDRMIIRALKTMPFMMATSESTTETQSNRQYEAHVAGIKAIQHLLEQLLERLLRVALQAQGIQARVEFRFAELRASELLRDAQAKAAEYANIVLAYNQGWIGQEEAAEEAVGHEPDAPAPRAIAAPAFAEPEPDDEVPAEVDEEIANEEGEERRRLLAEVRAARLEVARAVEELHPELVEGVSRNGHRVR